MEAATGEVRGAAKRAAAVRVTEARVVEARVAVQGAAVVAVGREVAMVAARVDPNRRRDWPVAWSATYSLQHVPQFHLRTSRGRPL